MKNFQIWKTGRGTTINTTLRECDEDDPPLDGDLVTLTNEGLFTFLPSTVAMDSAAARTIHGVCVQGRNPRGILYSPGRQEETADEPATVNIGGRGSRASSVTPVNQKFIAPIGAEDMWVLPRATDDDVVIGSSYGYKRTVTNGVVVAELDASVTDDVLTVIGFYSPDLDRGKVANSAPDAASAARVWVKAFLPAGIE